MGLADNRHIKNIRPDRTILTEMPKIEVHRHLEGTYPIESLFRMAVKNELDVPGTLPDFKEAFQFRADGGGFGVILDFRLEQRADHPRDGRRQI